MILGENMKNQRELKRKIVLSIFFLVLMIVGICSKLAPTSFSEFNTIENTWSGEIATSFDGGNGTKENPYQISRGEELAYFKSLIEGENSSLYIDKYYVLTDNINMGNLAFYPIGIGDKIFKGSIDGQGYSITNITLTEETKEEDESVAGLFTKLDNATIKNININAIVIELKEQDNLYVGALAGLTNNTILENIAFSNVKINILENENVKDINTINIGGISGYDKDSTLKNIYVNNKVIYKDKEKKGSLFGWTNIEEVSNVIINSDTELNSTNNKTINGTYLLEEVPKDILDTLNKDLTTDYYWVYENNSFHLYKEEIVLYEEVINVENVKATITPHASGIDGNTVYVNDLEADKNYYIGLNYTTSESGTLPTTASKNLYNDNNLVKVQITYDATTTTNGETITGSVSLDEPQNKYVYYKTYPVNNNGTSSLSDDFIKIELIDNPFTNRPSGLGFNGWTTNYSGAKISIDTTIYVRYVEIPITYNDNLPEDIVIDFKAKWTTADVEYIESNSSSALTNAIGRFNDASLQELNTKIEHRHETPIYGDIYDIDMSGYYRYETISRWRSYPSGSRNANGDTVSGLCLSSGGCSYYGLVDDETYNGSDTYYEWSGNAWTVVDINSLEIPIVDYEVSYTYTDLLSTTDNMSSYFERVIISRGNSYAGYYNANGEYQESGTCTTTAGCTYYKLLQYYNEQGEENTYNTNKTYYYLVTRDTNIMVLNVNLSYSWAGNQSKPLTFTGLYNGTLNNVTWTVTSTYVRANDDLVIENMRISGGTNAAETTPTTATGNTTSKYFYGGWNNVKIGRGITRNGNYINFSVAMGGINTNTGSSSSITEYRFVVESGYYSTLSLTGGASTRTVYINGEGIYGNDYDRVKEDNTKLDVYFCASGSWGNNVYKSGATSIAMHQRIKSGNFGSRRPTSTNSNASDYSYGIYVGGRNSGGNYTAREAIVEGGWIYNLIGGPISQSSNQNYNDSYIYVKGGTVDIIIGGAGRTTTYGNRIIQVTGGTISYSVFGGSNGITSDTSGDQAGKLTGTPYIYIGGDATIGNSTYVANNNTVFGIESGSVFGVGNGRSGTDTIGTAENSYIIIDGEANILRNVYGGGNYGAVGISTTKSTSTTEINVLGGTVQGAIFGGGNRSGSGSTSKTSAITINQKGGIVGNIYGGSNEAGTTYGSVTINALGGTVNNDIYGGGYGGRSNSSNGTYVRDKINIKIGDKSDSIIPTINGSVYGGSAFGSVNGTSNSTSVSSNGVEITVNEGVIKKSLFGGGKGNNTYTPYVMGNILITINDSNIADIFGGNDAAGTPNGTIDIHLKGGTIGRVFGGGNNASVKTNNIYLEGSNCTSIFGGSNASGTVTTSNIKTTSGSVDTIYGGNNTAGNTVTSNIIIDGATIKNAVYGGGNLAETETTNVTLNKSFIPNVFGGGANANISNATNIRLNGSIIGNLYGGSNAGGNVGKTTITIDNGYAGTVFGGNNEAGLSTTTNITLNNGIVNSMYGGGNKVGVTTSNITLNNGTSNNVYGGSNQSGDVTTTNITAPKSNDTTYSNDVLSMNVTNEKSYDVAPYASSSKVNVTISNSSSTPITKWEAYIITTETSLANNWSQSAITPLTNSFVIDETNQYWGTNTIPANGSYSFEFYTGNPGPANEFNILGYYIVGYDASGNKYVMSQNDGLNVQELYGGNNLGGTTTTPNITLNKGNYNNIYGGGNQAITNANPTVNVLDINVENSIYGGGNQATVLGNTIVNVNGNTSVGKNVFGGGNHGAIGELSSDDSSSVVNISGAVIGGNVYGGCNTSVVYGTTNVNIGKEAANINTSTIGNIQIAGTVFGGGEANESGSEVYDFSFISVTQGIDILIDGTGYDTNNLEFKISGSIFGSGNASSSAGPSNIYIQKLGTRKKPNSSISIQRADIVTLDNSAIELVGTTDRTNEYSNIKYSLNRIKKLKIKNNSAILLRENANMLQEFASLVDINGKEEKATVTIDDNNKTVTKNVDNRLYLLAGKNLNVSQNEAVTDYGVVSGMTFLGMYQTYSSGSYVYGMYDESKSYGSSASGGDVITGGSYVLGLHQLNHDITVDGYYTNYIDDDYTVLTTAYVVPTPPDSNYYMWTIGTASINYSFHLTASKYSSLGTYELSLKDFSKGNTIFNVIGFNPDGLRHGVELIEPTSVPKLAETTEAANNTLGLSMKTETTEWTKHGTTKFYTNKNPNHEGDKTYSTDNQTVAPSLMFYLYHAKNIAANEELGTVVISLQAMSPKNEIEYETQLITISVTIDTKDYDDGNSYDASITYSKKYEMPSATSVNITNKSQFTSYFALFAEANDEDYFYGRNNEYYHTLISNYALPVGTQITMIDYGANETNPNFYYYTVTQDIYNEKVRQLQQEDEITYLLSDFIKMDSTSENNRYNDANNNTLYYHENINYVMEEFIFIFDFKDTENVGEKLENTILFELRNKEDRTILSVLGIRQGLMVYNLYESSNIVLNEELIMDNNYLYYDTAKKTSYRTSIGYNQTESRQSIIDTNYESSSMGINIKLYDKTGTQVSSSQLSSTTITIDNQTYYVDSNGVFRIKLADKVSNLTKEMSITTGISLPTGNYKMEISLFASNDGLHNSSDKGATIKEIDLIVVGNNNLIIADAEDTSKLVIGETGLNMANSKEEKIIIQYSSVLEKPNIRMTVYKRDTTTSTTNNYTEYDAGKLFTNSFSFPPIPYSPQSTYEYNVTTNPETINELTYTLENELESGTYKIMFRLYDGNQIIDEDYVYIIIRKNV